ncbi:sigma 54-interacting transcriptional regulator [Paenibacillus abyssi]|uniref:HTH-type transcriptional regulatory protein TyrR n=1 Tax=Paenibacillus abyssi TaxID=1340531 RepID=A0A917G279_9BACL|nr:sigma 54-interacting transcriptional regulator [Paenibacillus abyssi]GGG19423.1 RNA polymerase subunit sigma-54 [Paenibacillus abyssi]
MKDYAANQIIEDISLGFIILDDKSRILYINQFSREKLNCPPEVVGQSWPEMFPHLLEISRLTETGGPKTVYFTIGQESFIAIIQPYSKSGASLGYMIMLMDASQLDEVTKELDAYKNLHTDLKAIFDISYDVIYVSDGNGITLRVSSASERLWGYKEEDLVGKSVYHLEKEGVYSPSVTRMVLEKKDRVSFLQTTKTGRRLMVVGTPIKDEQGNIVRVVNASRDITEISQLKNELEEVKQLTEGYKQELMSLRKKSEAEKKIIYRSEKMRRLIELAQKVGEVDSTVLLLGESGVGKEVIASYIHNWSPRKQNPFIILNCGSIPEKLLEAELFGQDLDLVGEREGRQIGLFKKAKEGTLYLDEITEMPLSIQAKLVGILEEYDFANQRTGESRVRIVASSSKNLEDEVKAGRFREDLYYWLNVIPITVPPLRERKDDILPLILYDLELYNKKYKKNKQLSANVLEKLQHYPWPGNIRELHNVIERLVVTIDDPMISLKHVPEYIKNNAAEIKDVEVHRLLPLKEAVEKVERDLLEMAKVRYISTTRMAEALGVNQSTISRKLQQYGISSQLEKEAH